MATSHQRQPRPSSLYPGSEGQNKSYYPKAKTNKERNDTHLGTVINCYARTLKLMSVCILVPSN